MQTRAVSVMRAEKRFCTTTDVICDHKEWVTETRSDKVEIKFKNLPTINGTETESFMVKASQKNRNLADIIYSINPTSTLDEAIYVVEKKGIPGYDSYVIEPKEL